MNNKIFIAHTHFIPPKLNDSYVGANLIAEFYPNLILSYYDKFEYFNKPIQFINFVKQKNIKTATLSFGIENISYLTSIVQDIGVLCENGLRSIQLYHHGNSLYFEERNGITELGKSLLKEMHKHDVILDLSHLPGEVAIKLTKLYNGKICISHCSCRDIIRRNGANSLSLNEIEYFTSHNVLIGICFVNDIILEDGKEDSDKNIFNSIKEHYVSLIRRFNHKSFCIGADYFDVEYFSKVYNTNLRIPNCLYSFEGYYKLYMELYKEGISKDILEDIYWNNAYDFYINSTLQHLGGRP